jgi:hypothetical protein
LPICTAERPAPAMSAITTAHVGIAHRALARYSRTASRLTCDTLC